MKEYLARYRNPQIGFVRHVVISAVDDAKAIRQARARMRTVSWHGCDLVWVRHLRTLNDETCVGGEIWR